jgi:hypothetical protein
MGKPAIVIILPLAFATCVAAAAAVKPFPPPNGWDPVQQQTPAGSQTSLQVWKTGSGDLQQTVMVLNDPSQPYDDAVQRIHKNIVDSKFKVIADKDQSCNGVNGHLFAMVYGPEAKRIAVDRLLLPDGSGIVQITYMRPEPEPFADAVKSDLNAYCGTTVR